MIARSLGAKWWPALAVAPGLTVSVIALFGILTDRLGIPWSLGSLAIVCLLLPGTLWAGRAALSTRGHRLPELEGPDADMRATLLGIATAATVAIAIVTTAQVRPGDIPQMPDVISHLGMVRYFLDNGTISSLVADGFNAPAAPGFYPAAFHAVAANLVLLTGAPVIIVDTVLLLVASALIWPVGLMYLVASLRGTTPRTLLATGLVASAGLGFPFLLLVQGPLWPLVFSMTMLPAAIALFLVVVRGADARTSWLSPTPAPPSLRSSPGQRSSAKSSFRTPERSR